MRVESYNINLDINASEKSFKGEEKINLFADNEKLVLNSVELNISKININGREVKYTEDPGNEEILVDEILNGPIEVDVDFSGKISDKLTGFYDASTEKGIMFSTQFESSGARRTFPCVDDPGYKAEFSLFLTIDKKLDAVSNMPVKAVRESNSRKTVEFEKTPRMSTYLLYIGVGEFEEREDRYDDKKIYLLAPRGYLSPSDFPFEIARKSLKLFEDYFSIRYMLPKMHLISVPQFAAGAMENWGAITFREVYMSVGKSTSARYRKLIAEVIAHEIAHHWFGDLVTMKWWNDLWLNESFATFMSYKMVNEMYPEWDTWGDFVMLRTSGALKGDALVNSHPIDAEVKNPNEVAQIFDEISYGKGGSILRMIESYVGHDNFRDGIRKYLKDHSYGNATGSDLWKSIEEISKQPVSRIMEAWIKKKGYPVVKVSRSGDKIHLTQEQFFLGKTSSSKIWPLPLTVVRDGETESILFEDNEMDLDADGFIKLNSSQAGFYRVVYDEVTLKEMLSRLEELTNLDRWGILNDLYALLLSGRVELSDYLSVLKLFRNESDPIVIEEISGQLSSLHLISPVNPKITGEAVDFFRVQLDRLGEKQEGESENVSILRGTLSHDLSILDDKFATELSVRFDSFSREDPDMRTAIAIAFAVSKGDFERLKEEFIASENDEDRTKLLSAMGWLRSNDSLGKVLELIKEGKVKKQDILRFYVSASANPDGRAFMVNTLEFAVKQLQEIFVGNRTAGRTIEQSIPLLGLDFEGRIRELMEKLRSPDLEAGINKGLELLEVYSGTKKRMSE